MKPAPARLIAACRSSPLAISQGRTVLRILQSLLPRTELQLLPVASGDTPRDWRPGMPVPVTPEQKGGYAAGVRDELLAHRADFAVHSAKDLPLEITHGLRPVACLARLDPRDCLVTALSEMPTPVDSDPGASPLRFLPPGAIIATSSPRRAAFLRHIAPHARIAPMRGNIDQRIRHLLEGQCDALLVAYSSLIQLRLVHPAFTDPLSGHPDQPVPVGAGPESTPGLMAIPIGLQNMVPSPGQGAIVLEAPLDTPYGEIWAHIDHQVTSEALRVERQVAATLDATCSSALGINARWLGPASANGPGWEVRIQREVPGVATLQSVVAHGHRAAHTADQAIAMLGGN